MRTRTIIIFCLFGLWWISVRKSTEPTPAMTTTSASSVSSAPTLHPTAAIINKASQPISPSKLVIDLRNEQEKLEKLNACLSSEACSYPQTDAKSYYFSVSHDAKDLLVRVTQLVRQQQIKNSAIIALARLGLEWPNDDVRSAAIQLIGTQPPASENISILIDALRDARSEDLVTAGLNEFQRYSQPQDQMTINSFVIQTLKTGPMTASSGVASQLGLLLNPTNVDFYRQALNDLPADSERYRALQTTLANYQQK
jgi:hypothetical protein